MFHKKNLYREFESRETNGSAYEKIENTLRQSNYLRPTENYCDFLLKNKIIANNETPKMMFARVANTLAQAGHRYDDAKTIAAVKKRFYKLLVNFEIVLSTTMYTNVGRHLEKSCSACAVPPVDFKIISHQELKNMMANYHVKGMGTGFNFDTAENVVSILELLNDYAIKEVHQGLIERPVGNMGILSVDHPEVLAFSSAKVNSKTKEWKFNISINLTEQFIECLKLNMPYKSSYGHIIYPREILQKISESAKLTGDPGVIFMHRHEKNNKTPQLGSYVSVAPCSEVPLLNGEVCHFAYINIYNFLDNATIDYKALRQAVADTVLLLDNAVELSILHVPTTESASIISNIRKIGIGICGFSDLLFALGIPYASQKAQQTAEDILSFINYSSKQSSISLAKQRGPFPLFFEPETKRSLILDPFFKKMTSTVSPQAWQNLNKELHEFGIRNVATVILPPTGRSALLAGVSTSIEPHFKLFVDYKFLKAFKKACQRVNYQGDIATDLEIIQKTGSILTTKVPSTVKNVFLTCLEISPRAHLAMAAALQQYTDEAISKTINLQCSAHTEEIMAIYLQAYDSGLKGISVYVDKSRALQPKQLSKPKLVCKSSNYVDAVYGPITIDEDMQKLIATETLQRLASIHQNGIGYLYDSHLTTTRLEHSIGVMQLVKMLGGDRQQQLMGLLHDIKHTAFSHVIDVIVENHKQNYHEQLLLETDELAEIKPFLVRNKLTIDDIYKLQNFPLIKSCPGNLTVDKLDYLFRDSLAMNLMSVAEIYSIINHLQIKDNIIYCLDEATAHFVFSKFLALNREAYLAPIAEGNTLVFKHIITKLIQKKELSLKHFNGPEQNILDIIKDSSEAELFKKINKNLQVFLTAHAQGFKISRKLRYIDPPIITHNGQRLTQINTKAKDSLLEYCKIPQLVTYDIPLLTEEILKKGHKTYFKYN